MESTDFLDTKFDGAPNYEVFVLGEKLKEKNKLFSVLDLGCGEGRNSFYLSGLNCVVDAIDIDKSNLERLQFLSKIYGRNINVICENALSFRFKKKYDIILSHGLLHFLSDAETEDLVIKIIKNTTDGGINIFTTAYYDSEDIVPISLINAGHKNQYTIQKLGELYNRWNMLLCEDYYKWDYHHSFGAHGHRIQKLIVQKRDGDIKLDTFSYEISDLPHKNNIELIKLLGQQKNKVLFKKDIKKTIKYLLEGPQLSFGNFAKNGLLIEFDFIENLLFQSNNNVISGITELKDSFTMIK